MAGPSAASIADGAFLLNVIIIVSCMAASAAVSGTVRVMENEAERVFPHFFVAEAIAAGTDGAAGSVAAAAGDRLRTVGVRKRHIGNIRRIGV